MSFRPAYLAQLGVLAAGVSVITLANASHPGTGIAVLEFPLELEPGTATLVYDGDISPDEGQAVTFYVDLKNANTGNGFNIALTGTATVGADYTYSIGPVSGIGPDGLITGAPGDYRIPIIVQSVADEATEAGAAETITVSLAGLSGLVALGTQAFTLSLNDTSQDPPVVAPVLNPPDPVPLPSLISWLGGMAYSAFRSTGGTTTSKASSYTLVGGNTYRIKVPRGKGYRIKHRQSSGSGTWVVALEVPLSADAEVERNADIVWPYPNGTSGNRYIVIEETELGGFYGDATHPAKFYKAADAVVADAPSYVSLTAGVTAVNEGSDIPFTIAFTDANAAQSCELALTGDTGNVTFSALSGITTAGYKVNVNADGSYSLTGAVAMAADMLTEGNKTLVMSLVNPTNGLVIQSNAVSVAVVDTSTTPPPVQTPTIVMTRGPHANVVNEGATLVTVMTLQNAPVGASWDISLDGSPAQESDFQNTLASDANNAKTAGVSATVSGRVAHFEVITAGNHVITLNRQTKADATTESTDNNSGASGNQEQVNFRLLNVTGLTSTGGTVISNWITDTSQSPPYTPPAATVTDFAVPTTYAPGFNMSGAEFKDAFHPYPSNARIDLALQGATTPRLLRVNLRILRCVLGGTFSATALDSTFLTEMARVINRVHAHVSGSWVILDFHDYGTVGSDAMGDGAFTAANCKRIVRMIFDQLCVGKRVGLDAMNEPHGVDMTKVFAVCQGMYEGMRESGHNGPFILPSENYSGQPDWLGSNGANVERFINFRAGKTNVFQGLHSYPDRLNTGATNNVPAKLTDGSDNPAFRDYAKDERWDIARVGADELSNAVNLDVWVNRWGPLVTRMRAIGGKFYVGEFGCGRDADSLEALDRWVKFMKANDDVFFGSGWWEIGPFPETYLKAIDPGYANSQLSRILQ